MSGRQKNPAKALDDRIAEQKLILEELLPILQMYKQGAEMDTLVSSLNTLNDLFKKIKIKQKAKSDANFTVETWGTLEVVVYGLDESSRKNQNKYDQEDLDRILAVSSDIREKIVN
ncbi:MAG: hypothetical protein HC880_01740 [Bacteroidia bacterium]|nr:hypothetical protein [Bacteroidia bacterium]